jgi:hypothetical protein
MCARRKRHIVLVIDLYKVNAFRLARVWGVDRADALRGFLFATRLGLFVPMS